MKALLREYLTTLGERGGLDVLLPDLLAESGFRVLSRPQVGTTQKGVDVAAVGSYKGTEAMYLFSIKPGDLKRSEWEGGPQTVAPSLRQFATYRRNRIAPEHQHLPVVGCLVTGGQMHETLHDDWTRFAEGEERRENIAFVHWNGDLLADMLLTGHLREEVMPREMRSMLQKAVAMADIADVSAHHFEELTHALISRNESGDVAERMTAIRQITLAASIVHNWCREIGNLDAAWQATALAVLCAWELARQALADKPRQRKKILAAVAHAIDLHRTVGEAYVTRLGRHADVLNALSFQVASKEYLDRNLALFDALGRVAMTGLWSFHHAAQPPMAEAADGDVSDGGAIDEQAHSVEVVGLCVNTGLAMIAANPVLWLPCHDGQATDITLFLLLCQYTGNGEHVRSWLCRMVERLEFTVVRRQRHPVTYTGYEELAAQGSGMSDQAFRQGTGSSTLLPLLGAWLHLLGETAYFDRLAHLVEARLPHCALQLWVPSTDSDERLYTHDPSHGLALIDAGLGRGGEHLVKHIIAACEFEPSLRQLSAVVHHNWPIVLTACRRQGLPVPPHLWIPPGTDGADGTSEYGRP
ncbi:hypothetical protein FHW69_001353 [Luteibacter sp. Sphag1AF]|uniref:hypothetical protein n=1 Tax=Luteibacter sp. Sphag1AF TaxID=2587031 RepID=UPI001617D362|nr:hypothetical protein [Luteibacter sp. Sphag1AF]MBB3226763.1 hypothetical protein [Luteibacter sp. Sphag1AF]